MKLCLETVYAHIDEKIEMLDNTCKLVLHSDILQTIIYFF